MLTPNHSTSIEVPHGITIKVLKQGTSIKVPNSTSMDELHTWLKIAEGVCLNLSYLYYLCHRKFNNVDLYSKYSKYIYLSLLPRICVPHAYYTSVSCVKSIQTVLAVFGKSLLIYKLACGTLRYFQQKLWHQKKGMTSVRQSGDLTQIVN